MIVNSLVPVSGAVICQTTASESFAITSAFFCNTSLAEDDLLTLYLVSAKGAIGNSSQIVNKATITATDTFVLDTEKLVLEKGDYLYAKSSKGFISGVLSVMDIS